MHYHEILCSVHVQEHLKKYDIHATTKKLIIYSSTS